jgi:protein-L-isoaspartate(D-aspartate) O-methyltransferase
MTALAQVRRRYGDEIASLAQVTYPPIAEAFAAVPRELFLGPGPWTLIGAGLKAAQTPDADPARVYANVLVVLDAALNLNNGEPRFWAQIFERLRPAPGEQVIHVGAGTGYYTALMAQMVGPEGHVTGIEYEPHLAARASAAFEGQANVEILAGDAFQLVHGAADVIVASAGLDSVPMDWLRRLNDGGRLMIPLTTSSSEHRNIGVGATLLVTRRGTAFDAEFVGAVGIYHCHSGRSEAAAERLRARFPPVGRDTPWPQPPEVASLRVGTTPDDSCWLEGEGWWISTAPNP